MPEPWALILDNADDPHLDPSSSFPVGNRGVVLITSRNFECKVHSTVGSYELGAMPTDEAEMLMLKTAGTHNPSDPSIQKAARAIVGTLGHLALAITQAGAVIRQGLCEIGDYCTLFAQRRQELLSQKAIQGGEDYRYTAYTTWKISRRRIEEMPSEDGQDALELLELFSFLHNEGIPEEIFQRAWRTLQDKRESDWMLSHQVSLLIRQSGPEWDSYSLRAAVRVLLSFSLIARDNYGLISIYPLVHAWVGDRLSPAHRKRIWMQATSTLTLSVGSETKSFEEYLFQKSLLPHVERCLEEYARQGAS